MADNPLMPGMGSEAPSEATNEAGPSAPPGLGQPMLSQHDFVQSHYTQVKASLTKLDHIRQALTALESKGDSVSPEDVVETAGDLVSKGMDPKALAATLATMPTSGGEALVGWLSQQTAGLEQKEQGLRPVLEHLRHDLGLSAIRMLAAGHFEGDHNVVGAGSEAPEGQDLSPSTSN